MLVVNVLTHLTLWMPSANDIYLPWKMDNASALHFGKQIFHQEAREVKPRGHMGHVDLAS